MQKNVQETRFRAIISIDRLPNLKKSRKEERNKIKIRDRRFRSDGRRHFAMGGMARALSTLRTSDMNEIRMRYE